MTPYFNKLKGGTKMAQNVVVGIFEVESEAFQAITELKSNPGNDVSFVSQAVLVKKENGALTTLDGFDTGAKTTDDMVVGGVCGALIGILGGPIGVLLGGSYGALIGSTLDMGDALDSASMIEQITGKLEDGDVAIIGLADEADEVVLDEKLKKFISLDSKLSLDITEEELDKSIGELAEKDKRYNILFGAVKAKDEYEGKLKAKEKQIETKSEEISAIKKAIESSQYDEENYKHMIILIDRLNKKFNESSKELAVNENNLNNFEITIGNLEELIEINRKNNEEFKAVDEYLQLLKYFRDMYSKDGIQEVLRSHSKPLIQKYTREFFEKFNFNYSDLILDDEYNISVFGPEGEANLDMVSGGEKIAIALALRLGITQAMSQGNIETILLDEPTIHLDSYRRQELINVLRSMSVIPQMLIVTHDQELETAADTLILVEKEDGISQVKVNN